MTKANQKHSVASDSTVTPLKVLVVDDTPENRTLLTHLLVKLGHRCITATDGQEAVSRYIDERPDVILMDVMMPGLDGFDATRQIRLLDSRVPVVLISARADEPSLELGLNCGADDYLIKPISVVVLRAKLTALHRSLQLQQREAEQRSELERYRDAQERERQVASALMERLVNADKLADPALRRWVAPAAGFSGDLVAAARSPSGVLHVLLADGTGHGLAASLNVLPITQPFYTMTDKGFPVATIMRELNTKVRELLLADRFIAAALVAVDYTERVVQVWNGGIPAVLALDAAGVVRARIPSGHLPLGILGADAFDACPATLRLDWPVQLLLCSDGLLEAEDSAGVAFGAERMLNAVSRVAAEARLAALQAAVAGHLGDVAAHDDVSLILVECADAYAGFTGKDAGAERVIEHGEWRFDLSLSPAELRQLDVVPLLLSATREFHGMREHASQLYLLLAELVSNALDHGILGLQSQLKDGADGMETFAAERHKRLLALTAGALEVTLEHRRDAAGWVLLIRVRDSGPGFDFATLAVAPLVGEVSLAPHGRGIPLVRALATRLEYHGCGNEVVAHYRTKLAPADALPFAA